MIAPSQTFQLHHPWWTVLFLTGVAFLVVGLVVLPGWGWIELRFSPVQRHYLPVYLNANLGVLQNSGPEHVSWIEKRAPNKPWEVAQPEDLELTQGEGAPFHLSQQARSQGWTELGYDSGDMYTQREIRDYLETNFYGGHSLLFFVLQPFELVAVGWMFWKYFQHWRKDLARERGLHWDPHYRPNTLDQDLRLFAKQLAQESKDATAQVRRWVTPKPQNAGRPVILDVESATVSPSQVAPTMPPIPAISRPKPASTIVAKAAEVTPVQTLKPAAPTKQPSQPVTPKPQPVEAQAEPKPTPTSPFGRPHADGGPERKWDVSQWID